MSNFGDWEAVDKRVSEKPTPRQSSRPHKSAKALYHNKTDVVEKIEHAPVSSEGVGVNGMKFGVCERSHDTTRCFQLTHANSADPLEMINKLGCVPVAWLKSMYRRIPLSTENAEWTLAFNFIMHCCIRCSHMVSAR